MRVRVPDPFTAKAWLGGIGVSMGLTGMALERHWLVWIGVGLLAAAFGVRFLGPPRPGGD